MSWWVIHDDALRKAFDEVRGGEPTEAILERLRSESDIEDYSKDAS